MNESSGKKETFTSFKSSFFYGSRSDMNFKFLAGLEDDQAALFVQTLFEKAVDAYDRDDLGPLFEHIARGQEMGYGSEARFTYDEAPFTPPEKTLKASRVALISSSGHFVKGDDPEPFGVKAMTQKQAEDRIMEFLKEPPKFSVIPKNTPRENLKVRHGGYDIKGSKLDPNVTFPIEILRDVERDGIIGQLADDAYSFTGACSQIRILKQTGPLWVGMMKEKQVDAALLVPV